MSWADVKCQLPARLAKKKRFIYIRLCSLYMQFLDCFFLFDYFFRFFRQSLFSQFFTPEVESRTGQPFRGQTLSRPKTGMLEAKAKDQRHSRKCSQKKGFQKSFSGNLQFIGVARIFDWGGGPKPQITCNDNHIKNFQKRNFFVGQRYRRMEDLKSLPIGT